MVVEGRQPVAHTLCRAGLSPPESLSLITTHLAQLVELVGSLDTYRHHAQVEGVPETNDARDYGVIFGVGDDVGDKGSIHLQLIDRVVAQVAEG